MGTGLSKEELKKKVEELAKAGDRNAIQELVKDADPDEVFTVVTPAGANARDDVKQKLAGTNAIVKFLIEGEGGGTYYLKITPDGAVEGCAGEPPSANATVIQNIADWRAVNRRELDPQMAFMQGKIKIQGDMSIIMKLAQLMRPG